MTVMVVKRGHYAEVWVGGKLKLAILTMLFVLAPMQVTRIVSINGAL